jgi:O-antigen/teichoic acid export membrane protein
MGLGFLFWIAAARLYEPAQVGLAAGAVSAMMLCTQLALLGVGSAFIARFPGHRREPRALLDTALSMVALSSLVAGGLFLLLASRAFEELSEVSKVPPFALAFLAACVLGTVGIFLDQAFTALRRGDQMLLRNLVFGGLALAALVVGALADGGAFWVFAPWVVAGLGAAAVGLLQLRRALGRYRYRPSLDRGMARGLIGVGVQNWLLTLTERAPGLILPIIVTELLSPATNAYWYAVWMAAWVLYVVPLQIGMNTFAELAHRPGALASALRNGIRTSLALGIAGGALLFAFAELPLSLLGDEYARAGATPLRLLVIAVVPLTFVQAYFAAARARGLIGRAIGLGAAAGAVAVAAAAAVAPDAGLVGMALAWSVVQTVAGAWAAWRLRRLASPAGPRGAVPLEQPEPAG